MDDKDVHTEHCCLRHGCKYSYDQWECYDQYNNRKTCTVADGTKKQSFPCEYCTDEIERKAGMEVWTVEEHDFGLLLISIHASLAGANAMVKKLTAENKDTKSVKYTVTKMEVVE